jgi:hypothetical protein
MLTLGLMGVALISHATGLFIAAAAALGVTALVFARELSEHEPGGEFAIPGSRRTRQVVLTVFGVILVAGAIAAIVAQL